MDLVSFLRTFLAPVLFGFAIGYFVFGPLMSRNHKRYKNNIRDNPYKQRCKN